MLIEFSVSNFRSFREKMTISMVAATRLRKKENTIAPNVEGEKLPALLKVAAIYGPNASGKSNLIKAMAVIQLVTMRQPSTLDESLPVAPFRFDKDLATKPSRFEVHFIANGQRYEFYLALTSERIVEERMTAFPMGKATLLYERTHSEQGDQYTFGDHLEGGTQLHETWRDLTGAKVLFIAQAVANSKEEYKQLAQPFRWMQGGILAIEGGMMGWAKATRKVLAGRKASLTNDISSFLRSIDVPITDIRFESVPAADDSSGLRPTGVLSIGELREPKRVDKTTLTHKTDLGEAEFDFDDESEGTKNLIGFWLPWHMLVSPEQRRFSVLVVDELDSSLHPNIVANLIEKHLQGKEPAQLIFTTHDTHLMDTKLLRRDQFWLTERDTNGATQLRSIHEFEGRESEDLEKRYYEGRYRGLPFVRRG